MAGTQVASYEAESAQITAGTNGVLTLAAAFTPAAGETIVVWFTGGSVACLPGAPAVSGGVAWTQRHTISPTAGTPIFSWTGVAPTTPGAVNPAVPYSYTGTGTTAAHMVVQRFSGITLPAAPNVVSGTPAATVGAGGMTMEVNAAAGSVLTWIGSDYNGVITGNPTPANGDQLAQSLLFPVAGELADWVYWRAVAAAGVATVGFSGFSTAATRKITLAAIELPLTPAVTANPPVSSLATDFSAMPAFFDANFGGAAIVGGQGQVPTVGTYAAFFTTTRTSLAGDAPYVRVVQASGLAGSQQNSFKLEIDAANAIEMLMDGGTFKGRVQKAGVSTDVALGAYSATTHAWWRIREAGGTVFFDTSTNGTAWTQRGQLVHGLDVTSVRPKLQAGFYGTETGTVPAIYDNFNTPPGPVTTGGAGTAVSGTRASSNGVRAEPIPTSPPTGADALQARTLTELRLWEQWLSRATANGFVGEFGTVSVWARFGDAPQQQLWTDLLSVYLAETDRAGIHTSYWASGRNWVETYTIGAHTAAGTQGTALAYRSAVVPEIAGHPSRGGVYHGVALSGWEEGVANGNGGAGTVRTGPTYPPQAADFTFMAADGIDFVRLAMPWELVQPALSGSLSVSALSLLDTMLAGARAAGIKVCLDLHNYARYTTAAGALLTLGDGQLTSAHLADFWSRMVTWLAADATRGATVVAVGLMNEPHDLPGGAATWQAASQAAVTAIRAAGN